MAAREDTETSRRDFNTPYTPHHPIPTVQRYRQEKSQREATFNVADDDAGPSWLEQAKDYWRGEKPETAEDGSTQPYRGQNKNITQRAAQADEQEEHDQPNDEVQDKAAHEASGDDGEAAEDTSEALMGGQTPRDKRKQMKKRKDDPTERTVTDPVTHLPIAIHDFTKKDLENTPQNKPPANSHKRSATGASARDKGEQDLREEASESQAYHSSMERMFPPPNYEAARAGLARIYQTATTVGLGLVVGLMAILLAISRVFIHSELSLYVLVPAILFLTLGLGAVVTWGMRDWIEKKVNEVWDDEVWEAERQQGKDITKSDAPESTQWLNSLLASIWPLVNPDLFTSVADTLEDVMQASLPRVVRMVSVEDLGQGSESIRILGIRWLPTGAAAMSVSEKGELKKDEDPKNSDRTVPGEGEVQGNTEGQDHQDDNKEENQKDENVAEGMEAEEGDFINMEIAFTYRARTSQKGIRDRAKNAHLYLGFYLPGKIKFPVWVELHGLIGTIRVRLQLTPDPPFFSLCTMTFLGQPKVDVSCIPLTRKGLNIMDLPLISNFVQSSVDAAMAEYVAPKSLTLDLKDMLMGDDFKKDTTARGVIVVRITRAFDFKEGDTGILWKNGSTDGYVSIGWAKFSKPIWSTRIIQSEMEPCWNETGFVLVTADELNVDERLRVQLWDSDRSTADDDLGRIELDIKQLMRDPQTSGKMMDRVDGFKALTAGEAMPGKLEWSVGYFTKTRILDCQLAQQTAYPDIRTIDQLKDLVDKESERKLSETKRDESAEIEQQKAQSLKEREDELLISAPPPDEYPSGILSVTIHQITGLEFEPINKNKASKHEEDEGEDLPSSYCTIILNHQKVFRTRTKPKNSQPFFNAGCERFIRDWRSTHIHVSVRDLRVHEEDALLGIVYLPLGKILAKRAQVNGFFPLSGGVGFGRARISMVWRSVQLQAPRTLLGWDYGTVEVASEIKGKDLPSHLHGLRLKAWTSLSKGKLHATGDGIYKAKHDRTIKLAVRKRYTSPLVIEFRKSSPLLDGTEAFAVFWFKDIPDNEEQTIAVPVWQGGNMKRATTCCTDNFGGEKVGQITLTLTFWSGLSGYHSKLAARDPSLGQTMEVLDTAHDIDETVLNVGGEDGSSSSSNDDSSDDAEGEGHATPTTSATDRSDASTEDKDSLSNDGKRGVAGSIKDYKKHAKQLHRRNRGLMQWKGPRTVQWMKHKLEHGEQRIENVFKHQEREPDIETEV